MGGEVKPRRRNNSSYGKVFRGPMRREFDEELGETGERGREGA